MKVKSHPRFLTPGVNAFQIDWLPCLACLILYATSLSAATPTNALVEVTFSEGPGAGVGLTTTNRGTLGGMATFAELAGTNAFPAFSTNVPAGVYVPSGNSFSVDFGTFVPGAEGRAVDLTNTVSPPGDGRLGTLPQVTVSGWVNTRPISSTRGQIVYALETAGGLGISLGRNAIGRIGLGVHEDSEDAPASVFALTTDANVGINNWVYFAATYDPTLSSSQLKYYFGRPDKLAALDSAFDYVGGDPLTNVVDITGPLTIGNHGIVSANRGTDSNAGNGLFRGLIDELKIYTNALTLDEIQQAQLNGPVTPVAASIIRQPANRATPEGQNSIFSVDATGWGLVTYQWKTNGVDVPGATNASLTLVNVSLGESGKQVRVGVSNTLGGALSSIATLTVLSADPHLMYLSFVEGTDQTTNSTISAANQNIFTANVGLVQGGARFRQQNSGANGIGAGTYPVFGAFVPTGPYAPSPIYNWFSLNMGDIRYTNYPNGQVASQGNRYLDFTNTVGSPVDTLGAMNGLTICGWLNAGSLSFRPNNTGMGNQIVFAGAGEPSRNGFVLSHKASWALQLSVNEWPGGTQNHSTGFVPVVTGADGNAIFPETNWVFFAVTYDGTLGAQNLNYYFGGTTAEVALDPGSPQDYNRGVITNTGPVTVGNVNPVSGVGGRTINGANAPFFRGFIDELHVFNRVLTLDEIKRMQVAPALPPYLRHTPQGNNLVLSWEAGQQPLLPAVQLQSRSNLSSGAWADVTTATNVSGSIRSLSVPMSGDARFFRLRTK